MRVFCTSLFLLAACGVNALETRVALPETIFAGKPALLAIALEGVAADQMYAVLPPAEEAVDAAWAGFRWAGVEANAAGQRLLLEVTAPEPGEFELPALQVRAIALADSGALAGESVNPANAVVVATPPMAVTIARDMQPYYAGAGVALVVLAAIVITAFLVLRRRKPAVQSTATTPQEHAREEVHAARRHRLDGNFYEFYLSLARAAEAIENQDGARLTQRAQEVGFKGVRPTDDEMDGDLKDIERAITLRVEEPRK